MAWRSMRLPWKRSVSQPPGCRFAIIRGIVDEQRDQAIAQEIGISYNTLRTQLSRLYRKLGVQTRVGVAVAAFTELITIRQKEVDARQKSGEEV